MSGRLLISFFLGAMVIFGAALWYFQNYAYYYRTDGLEVVEVQGRDIPVSGHLGIDADTSPNKLRACFTVDPSVFETVPLADAPEPLIAPPQFPCFDAEAIARDLETGRAVAYLAADETPEDAAAYEVLRMIAVYPDGRAFMWRHYRGD